MYGKRIVSLALLALLLAAPALAFRNVGPGQVVENATLTTLDGRQERLLGPPCRGATVVLFWASWSPRSLSALADLQRLYGEHEEAGLRVVAVNVEGEDVSTEELGEVREAVGRQQVGYPVLMDSDLDLYEAWGVVAVPSIALVGGNGSVVDVLDGYAPRLSGPFLARALEMARSAEEDCVGVFPTDGSMAWVLARSSAVTR